MKFRTGDIVLFNDRENGIRSALRQLIWGKHFGCYGIVVSTIFGSPLMLTNVGARWKFLDGLSLEDTSDVMVLRADLDTEDTGTALHSVVVSGSGIKVGVWSGLWFVLKRVIEGFGGGPVRKRFRWFPPIADSGYTMLYMYVLYLMLRLDEAGIYVTDLIDDVMQYDSGSFALGDLERLIGVAEREPWMVDKEDVLPYRGFRVLLNKYEGKIWLNLLDSGVA